MMFKTDAAKNIGKISNYYGGLYVLEHDGKFFWTIEDYAGFDDIESWQEIPESLYAELKKFGRGE